jgi:hypothetical protein
MSGPSKDQATTVSIGTLVLQFDMRIESPVIVTTSLTVISITLSLLDVEQCVDSGYNILREPQDGGMYTVAYRVDDAGRDLLVGLGRSIGQMGDFPACSTCTGTEDGTLLQGFRAEVTGTVTSLGSGTDIDPPTLQVTSAVPSNGRSDFCAVTQIVVDDSPTIAPSQQADGAPTNASTAAETMDPTAMPSLQVASAAPAAAEVAGVPTGMPSAHTNATADAPADAPATATTSQMVAVGDTVW